MKSKGRIIYFVLAACLLWPLLVEAQPEKTFSLRDTVRFALRNSFEVKLAKLDLYIAETDVMYEEAVFDMFLTGGAEYEEDKRQQLSVFASDDSQVNTYYGEATKTLPTGTELSAKLEDIRSWENSAFVSKNPSHRGELTLGAKQPIGKNIFGYIDRAEITLAKLAVENADLDTKDRIEELIAKTEKAHWELVFEERSLAIYYGILNKAKKLYQTDKKNFDVGALEKVDLLASEANVAALEADVLVSENSFARAEENLKLIMNIESGQRVVPAETLEYEHSGDQLPECLKKAFQRRRDYLTKKRDIKIKGLELKVKSNNKWPEIDLTGTMAMNGLEGKFRKAMGKTTVVDNVYYYAGVEIKIPVENKEARSEYKKKKYEKEKTLIELKEIERTIIAEVSNALRDVSSLEASLNYVLEAVEIQSKKLSEEEKRFDYGRSNTKRLIDYQQDLLKAQLNEAEFVFKHKKAMVDLDRKINIILEKYEALL